MPCLCQPLPSSPRIPSYMIFNVLPFIVPFGAFWMGYSYLIGTILVIVILMQFNKGIQHPYCPHISPSIHKTNARFCTHRHAIPLSGYPSSETIRSKQYLYTERNNQKYTSLKLVWPKTMNTEAFKQSPTIFCIVPHGVAPLGITHLFSASALISPLLHVAPLLLATPLMVPELVCSPHHVQRNLP